MSHVKRFMPFAALDHAPAAAVAACPPSSAVFSRCGSSAARPAAACRYTSDRFPFASRNSIVTLSAEILQVVVDHDAARHRPDRISRIEQHQRLFVIVASDLPQHRDVVEDVERPPVRADHQIVVLDLDPVHRRYRQIQTKRLPLRAVVERHVDAVLGAEEQQPLTLWDLRGSPARNRRREDRR